MKRTRPDLAAMNAKRATHGMSKSSTYTVWRSMLARCTNPKNKDFHRYGGRGIVVCERWALFPAFLEDMGERPAGMTLERKDNFSCYSADNCHWATPKEQARNRRSNVVLVHRGQSASVAEWAERSGLERKTLEYRIRAGWPVERALTTPSMTNRKDNHV